MKRENRLLKSSEFAKVYDYRHRVSTPLMTVYCKENKLGHLRVGLSVSKKVGKAHIRVRVRRLIRAMFNQCQIYDKSYDIVVVARKGFDEENYDKLYGELQQILTKFIKENLDEKTN